MIGDDKQLGPSHDYEFIGPKSLYTRLLTNPKARCCSLNIQYRMHEALIKVPNHNFYDNRIETGYQKPPDKRFLNLAKPLIFINVGD